MTATEAAIVQAAFPGWVPSTNSARDRLQGVPTPVRLGALDPWYTASRVWGISRWGPGVSAMLTAAASRFPLRPAIIDDEGTVRYGDLDRRATALAAHLRRSAPAGSAIGILCRNHRSFVIGQIAAERAGLDLVLLSTALPASRLADVIEREQLSVLIADNEFLPVILAAREDRMDGAATVSDIILADGEGEGSVADITQRWAWTPPPRRRSVLTLLTSGTTGAPKGARRPNRAPGQEGLALFEQVPYGVGDLYYIAPPLFHAWGLSQVTIALATASTVILRRRFEPEEAVALLAEREIDVLAVVPLMLRRILRVVAEVDTEGPLAPRIVVSSGNVLSGDLSLEWMDRFGDRLYNFYGSTETGIGTIARPVDMRRAPGTVGRPPRGVTLSILDDEGMPLPPGELGTIYLSSTQQFAGYSDGSNRERTGSLMASNDLGYLDDHGLLHVGGRAGDMIVTGGENVFPNAVEEVIERLPGIDLASVVGLADTEFGQRVAAFVVPQDDVTLDLDDLKRQLGEQLPSFMVPREINVVDALPMTTTGKVIRHQLAVLGEADRL